MADEGWVRWKPGPGDLMGVLRGEGNEIADNPTFQEPYQLIHPSLVEAAKFLPATKSTNHLMFNPRSLSSGKPFVRLHRTERLIVLYFRNVEYGVFKVLRQFCID
jgi:hypothetical protein